MYPNQKTESQTYQTIKDGIKNEILAEIQKQQAEKISRLPDLDRSSLDQKIQQMVDERYRTIDKLKAELKKELSTFQETGTQPPKDPYIGQIAGALAEEARRQGIPYEQLMRSLEQTGTTDSGMMDRITKAINTGQRRGFLYGVGIMVLCHLLLPSTRGKMYSVAVRSMEEGMAMVDRAKSFVSGQHQSNPPADSTNLNPESPPDGNQPPGE